MIGLTYDLKSDWPTGQNDPKDINAEFDKPETVESIARALTQGGHTVKRIGNVQSLLRLIDDLDVDIVLNICEGRLGRNRESQVPLLLELKGIPYIGSDALSMGITLDKIFAKKCFMADGIPTPRFFVAESLDDLKNMPNLQYPLMVKPHREGSSKGLSRDSRVTDAAGLQRQVELINHVYQQSALIEEFIFGTEFTVGVIGNKPPQALPVVQIAIEGKRNLGDDFYTFTRLYAQADQIEYLCPADISKKLSSRLQEIALDVFRSVDCKDIGRVDFRVDEKDNPFALEINPLPCLSEEDTFFFMAQAMGISYNDMINRIVEQGLIRYGLVDSKASQKILPSAKMTSAKTGFKEAVR